MLRTRVLTAIVLLALVGAAAAWSRTALQILFAGLVSVAGWEWLRLAGHGARIAALAAGASGIALVAVSAAGVRASGPLVAAVACAGCLLWIALGIVVARANRAAVALARPVSTGLSVAVLGAGWLALVRLLESGVVWLLSALAVVWIADIGAYFTGRAIGRHKLAPKVSPGKTWEGVAGALAGVVLIALSVNHWRPDDVLWSNRLLARAPLPLAVLALVAVVALSIVGDLFESLLKRQAGVKDSGRLLPGHGGVLDRIDASLPALPAAVLIDWWLQ
jgi:phosphatidate cytidylyltransferase